VQGRRREGRQGIGVELIFDGPTDSNAAKQNEIVENWITLGVDVIAVAAENREGISTALRKARKQGIKVVTYDADALPDARSFFVNQATPRASPTALMDDAARLLNARASSPSSSPRSPPPTSASGRSTSRRAGRKSIRR
jgi:rhamnose transport system substrate-binding protein